jgi:tetratricopeptide (TPR) repeat protein
MQSFLDLLSFVLGQWSDKNGVSHTLYCTTIPITFGVYALGNAYNHFQGGNRRENLERAIGCYKEALKVWSQKDFPEDWAKAQNNLGNAYSYLYGKDRQANLNRAIECYEDARTIFLERHMDDQLQAVDNKLARSRNELLERF